MRRNPPVRRIGEHVHDYTSADKFLGSKQERKLGHNTTIYRYDDDSIGVLFHRTTIVRYFPSGEIELNSGGWRTVTTKQRMNQLLPPGVGVSQRKHEWYAGDREFYDGMSIRGPEYRSNPRPRRIGKFDDSVSAIIYEFDTDADLSLPDGNGWWGLYLNVTRDELEDFDAHSMEELLPGELDSYRFPMHVILHERNDGTVQMTEYDTKRDAEEAWEELEAGLSDEEEDEPDEED